MLCQGRWEQKGVYVFYLELITDMIHLLIYMVFFVIVFTQHGLPLHLVRSPVAFCMSSWTPPVLSACQGTVGPRIPVFAYLPVLYVGVCRTWRGKVCVVRGEATSRGFCGQLSLSGVLSLRDLHGAFCQNATLCGTHASTPSIYSA